MSVILMHAIVSQEYVKNASTIQTEIIVNDAKIGIMVMPSTSLIIQIKTAEVKLLITKDKLLTCLHSHFQFLISLWFFIECQCNREGTESCDHMTGVCTCKPGIEGALCDVCKPDFFDFGNVNGCTACNCRYGLLKFVCE